MDSLSAILTDLRLHAFVTGLAHFGAPWGFRFPGAEMWNAHLAKRDATARPSEARPPPPTTGFHLMVSGSCWLEVDGEVPINLIAGDLAVVIGAFNAQTLRDAPTTPAPLIFDVLPPPPPPGTPRPELRIGGRGAVTSMIGGGFFFDSPGADRLLQALPAVIHLPADSGATAWLKQMTALLLGELTRMKPGSQAIIDSLAAVLFIHAVRHYVATLPADGGGGGDWTRALLDGEIGAALAAIHRMPQEPWSVASLGEHVHMSRSAFAAKFMKMVGQPPMNYLSEFRLRRAHELLREATTPIKEVARRVGYESEAAFTNAFKRRYQQPPRAVRGTVTAALIDGR